MLLKLYPCGFLCVITYEWYLERIVNELGCDIRYAESDSIWKSHSFRIELSLFTSAMRPHNEWSNRTELDNGRAINPCSGRGWPTQCRQWIVARIAISLADMVPEGIKEILAGIKGPCTETLHINENPRTQPASGSEMNTFAFISIYGTKSSVSGESRSFLRVLAASHAFLIFLQHGCSYTSIREDHSAVWWCWKGYELFFSWCNLCGG